MAYALRTSVEVLVTILVFLILIARKNVKEETKTDKVTEQYRFKIR